MLKVVSRRIVAGFIVSLHAVSACSDVSEAQPGVVAGLAGPLTAAAAEAYTLPQCQRLVRYRDGQLKQLHADAMKQYAAYSGTLSQLAAIKAELTKTYTQSQWTQAGITFGVGAVVAVKNVQSRLELEKVLTRGGRIEAAADIAKEIIRNEAAALVTRNYEQSYVNQLQQAAKDLESAMRKFVEEMELISKMRGLDEANRARNKVLQGSLKQTEDLIKEYERKAAQARADLTLVNSLVAAVDREYKSGCAWLSAPVAVAQVAITPSAPAPLVVSATLRLTVSPMSSTRQPLSGRTCTWQVASGAAYLLLSSASGYTVDATGRSAGKADIRVTCEGKVAQVAVTVINAPIYQVAITPSSPGAITGGSKLRLTATPKDIKGAVLTGRVCGWRVASGSSYVSLGVASGYSIDLTAKDNGAATNVSAKVEVVCEGKKADVTVTIVPAPVSRVVVSPAAPSVNVKGSVKLEVKPTDTKGISLSGRKCTWRSTAVGRSILSIGQPSGYAVMVMGNARGQETAEVTCEGVSSRAAITVK